MATTYYRAKVKENRLLELPEEAQELGLQPGEEVVVSVSRNDADLAESLSKLFCNYSNWQCDLALARFRFRGRADSGRLIAQTHPPPLNLPLHKGETFLRSVRWFGSLRAYIEREHLTVSGIRPQFSNFLSHSLSCPPPFWEGG